MTKRYQVFVSSTFTDLVDERQSVQRAILELDHMPAGMELFPAIDESAWQLIKDVIDASDYYVLIIGGRYGSQDENGIGYTEKEYDYAISSKKPVISLLHKNPDNLPRDKTETNSAVWDKLLSFRKKVEKRHTCVYWTTAEDLKAKVIVGLTSTAKRHPAIGWIRADQVPSNATLTELYQLRNQISELESSAVDMNTQPPKGTEDLLQGDDVFKVKHSFETNDKSWDATINPSWNEIFAAVAPSMISETSEGDLNRSLKSFFEAYSKKSFEKDKDLKNKTLENYEFNNEDIQTCIIQFRALGLIRESIKQRSIKDRRNYWCLTPFGDFQMMQLRALRKKPKPIKIHGEASPTL